MTNNFTLIFFVFIAFLISACTPKENPSIRIDGSNGVKPLMVAVVEAFQQKYPAAQIEMGEGMGSKKRIKALSDGLIDIAMASHGLDITKLTQQELVVHKISEMAVVFGVSENIDLSNITEEQVCDIYSGKVSNWQAINQNNAPIQALSRPLHEVDAEVLVEHIPCFAQLEFGEHIQFHEESGDMAEALNSIPNALGMTTMVRAQKSNGKIKVLSFNGITPSVENIKAGKYTLTRENYLVTRKEDTKIIQQLLDFIRSPEGAQLIIANSGVPVE